jgi:adenine-specific DNA-methyltransferase
MNTLNYIGCKNSLIQNIIKVLKDNIEDLESNSFLDLFAGTGIVGFNLQKYCCSIQSNDLEYYSYVINNSLLCCKYTEKLQNIIDVCNELEDYNSEIGLITKNFSPGGEYERMFFTTKNAKKADSVRIYIENLREEKQINNCEYYFLLGSLLTSLDKVANTASVYGAFLKNFKPASLKDFSLQPIHTSNSIRENDNKVYNQKAEELVNYIYSDIVYLDPPYNNRQYSANYSPLNFIAEYKDTIKLKGKTGLIEDYNKSVFCNKKNVKDAFIKLINELKCKYILLSYNDEGLLSFDDIQNILLDKGDVKLYKIKYRRFKSNNNSKKQTNYVCEYLWFVKVNSDLIHFYDEIEI